MLVKALSTQRKLVVCPYGTWLKNAFEKTKPSASEASFVLSFTSSFFFVDRCPILRVNHARTYLHSCRTYDIQCRHRRAKLTTVSENFPSYRTAVDYHENSRETFDRSDPKNLSIHAQDTRHLLPIQVLIRFIWLLNFRDRRLIRRFHTE